MLEKRALKLKYKAVIFYLDGVIVCTDECHYKGWKKLADEEGIYFDREINQRLRGVSRMESLEIVLEKANKAYTAEEKAEMAERKNNFYREYIKDLTPADVLPGVMDFCEKLRAQGVKLAIGSSSKNTPAILKGIGLDTYFDAVADGNQITKSKPDPEVFLLAAKLVGIAPADCMVVEDAEAGVEAAIAGGMDVLGLGKAVENSNATYKASGLNTFDISNLA